MNTEGSPERLNLISTHWTVVRKALQGSDQSMRSAQEQLLECYGGAIRRYVLAAVRDPDAADELFQNFAQRFIEGKLRGADPERGRFRDFVKGVLSHLIADFHARRAREVTPLPFLAAELEEPASRDGADRELVECWRDELLSHAWAALADVEKQTGQPFYSVLRLRADQPEMRSPQLAEVLTERLGKPFTSVAIRQLLHRARDRFADLLLDEVAHSLSNPTEVELEQELIELRLFTYCQAGLDRRTR